MSFDKRLWTEVYDTPGAGRGQHPRRALEGKRRTSGKGLGLLPRRSGRGRADPWGPPGCPGPPVSSSGLAVTSFLSDQDHPLPPQMAS